MNILFVGYVFLLIGLSLTFVGLHKELSNKYTVPKGGHVISVQNGYKLDWFELKDFSYAFNPELKVKILTIMPEEEITQEPANGQDE